MVPEIWSKTSRIFCHFLDHFLLFYPPNYPKNQNFEKLKKEPGDIIMCTINDNHIMYGSWDIKHDRQDFFVILNCFLPFYPPNNPKNHNFEKLKKKNPGDIIILHMCTINDDHMMYGSWDMKPDKQNFLSFWTVFCIFTPLTT